MDRDLQLSGFLARSALPLDPAIIPGEEGQAMQATINNGSAEHGIAEAIQEAEVSKDHPAWVKIVAALGFATALAMLVWMLFK